MKQQGLFSVNLQDGFKAVLMTVLTTLITSVYPIISAGGFPTWIEFRPYLITSISAGIAYVIKNFLSNNNGKFAKADEPTKVVAADEIVVKPQDVIAAIPVDTKLK